MYWELEKSPNAKFKSWKNFQLHACPWFNYVGSRLKISREIFKWITLFSSSSFTWIVTSLCKVFSPHNYCNTSLQKIYCTCLCQKFTLSVLYFKQVTELEWDFTSFFFTCHLSSTFSWCEPQTLSMRPENLVLNDCIRVILKKKIKKKEFYFFIFFDPFQLTWYQFFIFPTKAVPEFLFKLQLALFFW